MDSRRVFSGRVRRSVTHPMSLGLAGILVVLVHALGARSSTWEPAPLTTCENPTSAWAGNIGASATVYGMHVGNAGDILLAGEAEAYTDFDPTDGVDTRPELNDDLFVTCIRADGSYGWTYTVAAPDAQAARGVTIASGASTLPTYGVLLTGLFRGTVDFDPSDTEDRHRAVGDFNAFVTKLTAEGAYVWTVTFGQGEDDVSPRRLAVDTDSNILLVGSFTKTADFDPSEGTDLHTATPISRDIFVTKLGPDGSYGWTRTFGGTGLDKGTDIAVDADGDIFVTGTFSGTADFDPGPGEDWHTAVGMIQDIFITKLHADGSYAWTRTSPAQYEGGIGSLAVDAMGDVYACGGYTGTVDFDPTDGVDTRVSVGSSDIFVTKLHGDGSYAWTWTVGGSFGDVARSVALDALDGVFVTGQFWETVDFDPGPGIDAYTSGGADDVFVTELGSDGSYRWTRTFGSALNDSGRHIGVDPTGAVIVAGAFHTWTDPLDLDPGCETLEREVHLPGSTDIFINKLVCIEATPDDDGDGDVDLRDFAAFQTCYTGDGMTECGDGCATLDFDRDDDIDTTDLATFTFSLLGP